MPIVTKRELNFNADFKYISFIKFRLCLPIKIYEPEKICVIVKIREKHSLKIIESKQTSHHQIQLIRKPNYKSFQLESPKMWNFVFFLPEARSQMRVCLFVFFQGVIVSTIGPKMLREGSF